jgi:hypothetical protein
MRALLALGKQPLVAALNQHAVGCDRASNTRRAP